MIARIYSFFHRLASRRGERGEYSSGVWQDMARSTALALCKGRKGRLLEIGCGEGLFLSRLKEQEPGIELYGIDSDTARIQQAIVRCGSSLNLSVQDACRLQFAGGHFDTVVCVNVIFNLASPQQVEAMIKEIARVSRPGATVILEFRNSGNPLLALKYGLAPWYDPSVKDLPLRTYGLGRMKRMLAGCGLTVREVFPVGFSWTVLAPVIMIEAVR